MHKLVKGDETVAFDTGRLKVYRVYLDKCTIVPCSSVEHMRVVYKFFLRRGYCRVSPVK
jgi:hypothetical protein